GQARDYGLRLWLTLSPAGPYYVRSRRVGHQRVNARLRRAMGASAPWCAAPCPRVPNVARVGTAHALSRHSASKTHVNALMAPLPTHKGFRCPLPHRGKVYRRPAEEIVKADLELADFLLDASRQGPENGVRQCHVLAAKIHVIVFPFHRPAADQRPF